MEQIKQHRVAATVLIALFVTFVLLVFLGYWFNLSWVGVNGGYSKITTSSTIHGITTTTEQPLTKTFWDWLQLLIIPTVLAIAGYVINLTISRGEQAATAQCAQSERDAAEKRAETERDIALDNQREAALKEYLDKMSELLLLNGLYESGLLGEDKRIMDLSEANLSGADLSGAYLSRADLSNAKLNGANLNGANLSKVILSGAYLSRADLSGAELGGANLSKVTLSGANLSDVKLNGADLSFSNLRGAYLGNANLNEATLIEANLSGARGTIPEQLNSARSLKGTIMPDGSKHL